MLRLERARRVVIVAAHPDDEVIGAGGILPALRDVHIIHTTDGSPRDPADALRNGFTTREEYAAARRSELICALNLGGVPAANAICLGFTDQETMHHLAALCQTLAAHLKHLEPDAILTQPYEGGHPDHDSTAFAVHSCLPDHSRLFEMTSYHAQTDGTLITGRFLASDKPEFVRDLTPEDKLRKERMLACFQSQSAVLKQFPLLPERFRCAPKYDFTRPPHPGTLHYERMPWGITGQQWRSLAAKCHRMCL